MQVTLIVDVPLIEFKVSYAPKACVVADTEQDIEAHAIDGARSAQTQAMAASNALAAQAGGRRSITIRRDISAVSDT